MSSSSMLQHVIKFLQESDRMLRYRAWDEGPYFLAIQGVQGSGKSTLAQELAVVLRSKPWWLETIVISIDDFYLTHADQKALAKQHSENPLIQHRGQASTHDIELWRTVFEGLREGKPTAIPKYDKSQFDGQGDRVDPGQWKHVDDPKVIKVVIFEGWSVGFRSLPEDEVKAKWEESCRLKNESTSTYTGQLGRNRLEDILFVNSALKREEEFHEYFSDLIQIDSDIYNVYKWRLQQEHALRASKGSGMTDEKVKQFIDGYFPSYELYTEPLRQGTWRPAKDGWLPRHIRLCVDEDRQVSSCIVGISRKAELGKLSPLV